jgi:hypothetical protein
MPRSRHRATHLRVSRSNGWEGRNKCPRGSSNLRGLPRRSSYARFARSRSPCEQVSGRLGRYGGRRAHALLRVVLEERLPSERQSVRAYRRRVGDRIRKTAAASLSALRRNAIDGGLPRSGPAKATSRCRLRGPPDLRACGSLQIVVAAAPCADCPASCRSGPRSFGPCEPAHNNTARRNDAPGLQVHLYVCGFWITGALGPPFPTAELPERMRLRGG